jgi:hypothetical protein
MVSGLATCATSFSALRPNRNFGKLGQRDSLRIGKPQPHRQMGSQNPILCYQVVGAFLLYSHAADSHVAASLQDELQTIAKPWHRLRSIRVFRDASDLSATPELWPALTQALDGSKYVVLLASPEAATSAWVSREYWLDHRRLEEILIALTGGEIVWDAQLGDFDWRATRALPTILKGAFKSEPLFVDLRGLQANEVVLADPRFPTSVASFAAAITGQSLSDIVGEDVRQHRRTRRLALGMVLLFFSLLIALFISLYALLPLKGQL